MQVYNRRLLLLGRFFNKLARIFALIGIVLIFIAYAPSLWYWVETKGKDTVSGLILQTASTGKIIVSEQPPVVKNYEPQYDSRLPFENRIKIPSIRIDTQIQEATSENFESALKKGVWRVSDFGTPYDRSKPTILAAHRYGYLAWSIPYRLKNSFYSLPRLKVGEIVEIIWRQRKYTYEVYAEGKGDKIEDYSANLILYTCEALNSPVRVFKYARLLEI